MSLRPEISGFDLATLWSSFGSGDPAVVERAVAHAARSGDLPDDEQGRQAYRRWVRRIVSGELTPGSLDREDPLLILAVVALAHVGQSHRVQTGPNLWGSYFIAWAEGLSSPGAVRELAQPCPPARPLAITGSITLPLSEARVTKAGGVLRGRVPSAREPGGRGRQRAYASRHWGPDLARWVAAADDGAEADVVLGLGDDGQLRLELPRTPAGPLPAAAAVEPVDPGRMQTLLRWALLGRPVFGRRQDRVRTFYGYLSHAEVDELLTWAEAFPCLTEDDALPRLLARRGEPTEWYEACDWGKDFFGYLRAISEAGLDYWFHCR